ncbi:MAG: hypothetical protein JW860_12265 [Sedimentisphaerales bacterium]|nr:hypothetical protein [Sedimentisphaerales bacterium]
MKLSTVLLNAYYEALYDRLHPLKEQAVERMDRLLSAEIDKRYPRMLNEDGYAAYLEACAAFWDERLETYNPTGIQYLFDTVRSAISYELETQLSWYDSRRELDALMALVCLKAEPDMTAEQMSRRADEIIRLAGAFPDQSIIQTYLEKPDLEKVPDYIVATAIEESIRQKT